MTHTLHVGHGTHVGAVTLFPVWTDEHGINGLDWSATALRVAEREGSPVVGELVVQNDSRKPVVLLEGDLLAGGWQDRMLAAGTILGPRQSHVIEVVCVEHGRWSGGGAHEVRGGRGAASVRYGLARAQQPTDEPAQHQVWQRIGRFETELQHTATSSMVEHLNRAPVLTARRLPGQRGVVVGIGGVVAWGEQFGSTAGLASRWEGILAAATLDAQLAPDAVTTASAARQFVSAWAGLDSEPEVDYGPVVSQTRQLSLSGIRARGRLVHTTVFNKQHPMMENA